LREKFIGLNKNDLSEKADRNVFRYFHRFEFIHSSAGCYRYYSVRLYNIDPNIVHNLAMVYARRLLSD
jgi:hypothetical protein